jgi:EH domain-containing protein 1
VVKLFSLSQLPRGHLKQVWAVADAKRQGFLGFKEFVAAMQMISLAQASGKDVSADMLSTCDVETISPPKMDGLEELLMNGHMSSSHESTCNGNVNGADGLANGHAHENGNGTTPQLQLQTSKWFSQKPTRKVGVEGYRCDIDLFVKVRAGYVFSLFAKSNIIISLQIIPVASVTSIVDGLKKLYLEKLKPLEIAYRFHDFALPMLTESDFDAKPSVMLLGQYSTGKTTFIKHLLGSSYPGAHVGPEPTTDRFVVVMEGADERSIPGNTIAVQGNMPFTGLTKFGGAFLSKFECSQMPHPLLEHLTFVDTPGVLSGEKQRTQRSYEFTGVTEWFAAKCDMILLLFDPHKLDISDEFKRVIMSLHGQDDKIRVVLNKADQVGTQQVNSASFFGSAYKCYVTW